MMIKLRIANDPLLRKRFEDHPHVEVAGETDRALVEWDGQNGIRSIVPTDPGLECSGLVEIMDNNPLVCAYEASVPDPGSTLALIALGPAIHGRVMVDTPVVAFSFKVDEANAERFLAKEGWSEGVSCHCEPYELESVVACKAMVEVERTAMMEDLKALYNEAYERSFFVRCVQDSTWGPELVVRTPIAIYRLELMQDERASLLKIHVLADQNGKCGSAQVVHMFNVMCGFEESAGIS